MVQHYNYMGPMDGFWCNISDMGQEIGLGLMIFFKKVFFALLGHEPEPSIHVKIIIHLSPALYVMI